MYTCVQHFVSGSCCVDFILKMGQLLLTDRRKGLRTRGCTEPVVQALFGSCRFLLWLLPQLTPESLPVRQSVPACCRTGLVTNCSTVKDRKVLCEEKWRNETQSVWCFTVDAVDPGYLARRPHCILFFPRECHHFYVQEKQSSRETGAQNQLEHTHPPLASFSSPCPSPERKMSC